MVLEGTNPGTGSVHAKALADEQGGPRGDRATSRVGACVRADQGGGFAPANPYISLNPQTLNSRHVSQRMSRTIRMIAMTVLLM